MCGRNGVYNRKTGSAGMNHFLRDRMSKNNEPSGKFGYVTMYLIKKLSQIDGIKGGYYEAKIFGGGAVVGN